MKLINNIMSNSSIFSGFCCWLPFKALNSKTVKLLGLVLLVGPPLSCGSRRRVGSTLQKIALRSLKVWNPNKREA